MGRFCTTPFWDRLNLIIPNVPVRSSESMKMRPFDFFVVRDKGSAVLEKFHPMEQFYPNSARIGIFCMSKINKIQIYLGFWIICQNPRQIWILYIFDMQKSQFLAEFGFYLFLTCSQLPCRKFLPACQK